MYQRNSYGLEKEKANGRTRTDDLIITNDLLCRLSYVGSPWTRHREQLNTMEEHRVQDQITYPRTLIQKANITGISRLSTGEDNRNEMAESVAVACILLRVANPTETVWNPQSVDLFTVF